MGQKRRASVGIRIPDGPLEVTQQGDARGLVPEGELIPILPPEPVEVREQGRAVDDRRRDQNDDAGPERRGVACVTQHPMGRLYAVAVR